MADAKLTALTAASALAAADLFYVSQSAASRKATGTQLLALVGTTYVPLAGGTMTGLLTVNTGATTTSSLVVTGYLTVGNDTTFKHTGQSRSTGLVISSAAGGFQYVKAYAFTDVNAGGGIGDLSISGGTPGVVLGNVNALTWSTSTTISGSVAASFYLDATASVGMRNGTAQQKFSVYNTYTDSSNYERLTLTGVAGASVNLTAETLGTGADNIDLVITTGGTGSTILKNGSAQTLGTMLNNGYWIVRNGVIAQASGSGNHFVGDSSGAALTSAGALAFAASATDAATTKDAALRRASAGVLAIDNGTAGTYRDLILRNVKTDPVAFASLVAAATAGNGARAMITNCSHATFGTAADGGGSTKVPVYSDGTNWLVG